MILYVLRILQMPNCVLVTIMRATMSRSDATNEPLFEIVVADDAFIHLRHDLTAIATQQRHAVHSRITVRCWLTIVSVAAQHSASSRSGESSPGTHEHI